MEAVSGLWAPCGPGPSALGDGTNPSAPMQIDSTEPAYAVCWAGHRGTWQAFLPAYWPDKRDGKVTTSKPRPRVCNNKPPGRLTWRFFAAGAGSRPRPLGYKLDDALRRRNGSVAKDLPVRPPHLPALTRRPAYSWKSFERRLSGADPDHQATWWLSQVGPTRIAGRDDQGAPHPAPDAN